MIGLEKRVKMSKDVGEISVTELDATPLNQVSFQMQEMLFEYCGISNKAKQKV